MAFKFSTQKKLMNSNISCEENDDDTIDDEVKVIDNNIYFYCPVDNNTILQLTSHIKEVTKKNLILGITYNIEPPDINLYINSQGGCVYSALSILDIIINNKVKINSIITGVCMSAATLISMVCHNRYITPHGYMLIHNMSIEEFWGKMHEFEDEMKNMTQLTNKLKSIYKEYGSINKTQLEGLLKKDLLLNSSVAKKYGFVDEIKLI